MNLKKLESYLGVNLLGPGARLIKKEFAGPRSRKGLKKKCSYVTVDDGSGAINFLSEYQMVTI